MTDLTKITTPFGLLDEATQNALLAHGGPYEVWSHGARWVETAVPPKAADAFVWRVKPQPPKPREFWVHIEDSIVLPYEPDMDGSFKADGYIHVREVLE